MGIPVSFQPQFERCARRVRRRLALRHALTGAAAGLFVAVVAAGVAWKTRQVPFQHFAGVVGVVGLLAGWAVDRRRRWSDVDVALYLDERLATHETITTAVQLERETEDEARAVVLTSAAAALGSDDARRALPRLMKPAHALVPLACAALALIARAPLPPAPPRAGPPGVSTVQLSRVDGLKSAIALAQLDARDAAQRQRLDKIARDADKLRTELESGLQKRDAEDRIARLRDAILAERLSLGDGERRAGLESAVAKLAEQDATKRAAQALADHDLTTMDAQMERLANERETADREAARHALDEAGEAARKNGAPDVAKALGDEKRLTDERTRRADALRELGDAMKGAGEASDELKTESEALDRKGTDAAARQLAESMAKALEKLTPEERKRLADQLRREAGAKGASPASADALKELADELSTPQGQKQLEDRLKDMAKESTDAEETKRQQALDDAQRGAAGTQDQIGKGQETPQGSRPGQPGAGEPSGDPQPGAGSEPGQTGTPMPMPGAANGDQSGSGGTHDTGTGSHAGKTAALSADTLRSRAKGPLSRSAAMPGAITTTTTGRPGGTANVRGTGDLRVVGPSEVDGVERSDVPEEYREHVRQYFQP
jgi:hypothetical protein